MVYRGILGILAACSALSACGGDPAGALAPGVVAASMPVRYVALGDSYSSGHGTVPKPDMSLCSRTGLAYGPLWAGMHPVQSFSFVACQGATTANVIDTPQTAQGETSPQLAALDTQTNLVTITIGGNDVGFAEIAKYCAESEILDRDTAGCTHRILEIQELVDGSRLMPDNTLFFDHILRTYTAIRTKVSPDARIFVLGYPQIYYLAPGGNSIGPQSRQQVDALMVSMNDQIRRAAALAGVTFVDVDPYFAGHGAGRANPNPRWINDISLFDSHISLHPNADGHALGDLPALQAATGG